MAGALHRPFSWGGLLGPAMPTCQERTCAFVRAGTKAFIPFLKQFSPTSHPVLCL